MRELGESLFVLEVQRLRALEGMNDDYVARQIVDDFYRSTGESLHLKQHIVECLVNSVTSEGQFIWLERFNKVRLPKTSPKPKVGQRKVSIKRL